MIINKTLQQLQCDPIFDDYQIEVSAQWLKDLLNDYEKRGRIIKRLQIDNDILKSSLWFRHIEDEPKYRLNIKG